MRQEEKEKSIRHRLHGSFHFKRDAISWPHDALCRCKGAWIIGINLHIINGIGPCACMGFNLATFNHLSSLDDEWTWRALGTRQRTKLLYHDVARSKLNTVIAMRCSQSLVQPFALLRQLTFFIDCSQLAAVTG